MQKEMVKMLETEQQMWETGFFISQGGCPFYGDYDPESVVLPANVSALSHIANTTIM